MLKDALRIAKIYIENAEKILAETPEKNSIARLIKTCKELDLYYMYQCAQSDGFELEVAEDYTAYRNLEDSTYKDGMNSEFYIEGSDWHEISLALRELEELAC